MHPFTIIALSICFTTFLLCNAQTGDSSTTPSPSSTLTGVDTEDTTVESGDDGVISAEEPVSSIVPVESGKVAVTTRASVTVGETSVSLEVTTGVDCNNHIPGCTRCISYNNQRICKDCKPGYALSPDETQCVACNQVPGCIYCRYDGSNVICYTCEAYRVLDINKDSAQKACPLCSTFIPNCLACIDRDPVNQMEKADVICKMCASGYTYNSMTNECT